MLQRHREAVGSLSPSTTVARASACRNSPTITSFQYDAAVASPTGSSVVGTRSMGIFRSPKTHIHGNKNVYDSKQFKWYPSNIKQKDERFASANDCRNLEKTVKFLYTSKTE